MNPVLHSPPPGDEAVSSGEQRDAFLLRLSDAMRPISDSREIQSVACRLLGRQLRAGSVHYSTVDEERTSIRITRHYMREHLSDATTCVPSSDFDWAISVLRKGRPLVVSDVFSSPIIPHSAHVAVAALQIGSFISVPLVKEDHLVACLNVTDTVAREWTLQDLELTQETAERTWASVERAAAEELSRRNEEKYRSLFNSIDEGFCLIEVLFDDHGTAFDYRFVEANPAFAKQTGLHDVVGHTIRKLAPTHDSHWFEIYGRIAVTGHPERFEQPALAFNRFYDVYAFRVGDPAQRRVAVLFNDISARKQAETAISADLRDTQLLRDLSVRLVTETENQAIYDEINATSRQLMQADAGTVQIFDTLTNELILLATHGFPPDSPQRFGRVSAASATSCGQALSTGQRTFFDFDDPALPDPKGDLRWHVDAGYLSAQSTPLIARSGRPIGMISTHWTRHHRASERELRYLDLLARQTADLLEQRQVEAALRESRAEIEASSRAKDKFLAILSHELRTPLTPVVMATELLRSTPGLDPAAHRSLDMISRNVQLECRLIDDLLDVTRIIHGRLEMRREPLDLHQVIREAIEISAPDLQKKAQHFTSDLSATHHRLTGDSDRLEQTIWNLLKNASKFTPSQGHISLFTRNEGERFIVEISDTGLGIEPEKLAVIFNAFTQANENICHSHGGLGLGLAIARATVEAHGGTIHAASPGAGQGATIIITLPVDPAV